MNYRLSAEEEKLPECNLLSFSSIEDLADRSGRTLKSFFAHSHSLTRMHNKAPCQQS